MPHAPSDLKTFEANATQVADILRALANERRMMILCKLVEWGEASVGTLAEAVGLSPSALSQHLAKMRDEGIVAGRRESQTIWYRVADPRTEKLLGHLQQLYCPSEKASRKATAKTRQGSQGKRELT
jgi:ArsR family transcriptional regulator, virulence genes transcriptional regulator